MAYLGGMMRFMDGDERMAVGITVAKLRELLDQLEPEQVLFVNPVTRHLVTMDAARSRWVCLANETIDGVQRTGVHAAHGPVSLPTEVRSLE